MQLSDVLKLQEKTWTQKGNGVNAVINTVHKATQGKFNWKQPVNVTDLTGAIMDITFETEYPESLLSQAHVGKRAIWRLKWWKGRGGQNISGYPEQQLDEAGQPEKWQLPTALQPPQNPQQAPQQPAQPTNSPQSVQLRMPDTYAYPVTPETQARMARCAAGEASSRIVAAMIKRQTEPVITKEATIKTLLDIGDILSRWMIYGINVANVPRP